MPSEASKSTAASAVSSFASLLAGLTAPKPQADDRWADDILAEDVATISYEQALRTHTRYRRPDPLPAPPEDADPTAPKPPQSVRITEWIPEDEAPQLLAESHKTASVTLRMSQAESARLRKRAGDAGLTVSGYLRSCIFEVESLRTQVKEALARLQLESPVESKLEGPPVPLDGAAPRGWAARLFPGRHRDRNIAEA